MAIVLADTGAAQILKSYFNKVQPAGGNNLTLRLFTNNISPDASGAATSYTEASGGGYAAVVLTAGQWTVSTTNDPRDAVYNATITFTFSGALTGNPAIYGYYITDADGVTIYAEKAPGPFQPTQAGDVYKVVPKFALSYGTPTA